MWRKKKCTEKGGLIPCLRLKKYEDLQTHAMKGYHSFNLSSWKVLRKMKKILRKTKSKYPFLALSESIHLITNELNSNQMIKT